MCKTINSERSHSKNLKLDFPLEKQYLYHKIESNIKNKHCYINVKC